MSTVHAPRPPVNRKPVKPVSGVCRWRYRPGCFMCGPNAGVLAVGETTYVVRLCRENGARSGRVVGSTLTKPDGTQYTLDLTTGECDCPDAYYRKRECKHHKAAVSALKAIGEQV
jgi:hypothetical protein